MQQDTLCWTCQVPGTGGCSWDRHFQPVDGWTAEATVLRSWDSDPVESYCVTACPLYVPMKPRRTACHLSPGKPSVLPDEKLLEYLLAGLSDAHICVRSGLSICTIQRRRRKLYKMVKGGDGHGMQSGRGKAGSPGAAEDLPGKSRDGML